VLSKELRSRSESGRRFQSKNGSICLRLPLPPFCERCNGLPEPRGMLHPPIRLFRAGVSAGSPIFSNACDTRACETISAHSRQPYHTPRRSLTHTSKRLLSSWSFSPSLTPLSYLRTSKPRSASRSVSSLFPVPSTRCSWTNQPLDWAVDQP